MRVERPHAQTTKSGALICTCALTNSPTDPPNHIHALTHTRPLSNHAHRIFNPTANKWDARDATTSLLFENEELVEHRRFQKQHEEYEQAVRAQQERLRQELNRRRI